MKAGASRRLWQASLLWAIVLALGVCLLYPILLTVRGGLAADPVNGTGWTLEHIRLVFQDPSRVAGIVNSLTIAAGTTALAIAIGFPLALLATGRRFPGKGIMSALVLAPLVLPPFVGAIGMRAILGRQGALATLLGIDLDVFGEGRLVGVIVVEALALYPIIYLNASAALANLDPALGEAATNLGSGPLRRFFRVTLPLVRPGLFAGGTIVFIWSFTELGTPLMFDMTEVTPVQVFNGLKEVETSAEPYALTIVMLTIALCLYALGKWVLGRSSYSMTTRAARAAQERPMRRATGLLALAAFALVSLCAMMPHVGVILSSLAGNGSWYESVLPTRWTLDHYGHALTYPDASGAITNSLLLATLAMIAAMGVGLLVGYLLVRTRVWGRGVLDTMCMLPLAVPGLVLAFGYVAVSMGWPFETPLVIGPPANPWLTLPAFLEGTALDVEILGATPNPFPLLVLAYAVRRLPYMVRSTVAGLEQTSGDLEDAAMNLGASRLTAVRKIVVPLVAANLIAGGLLVFAFSMLEVSDSLILAQQPRHYPLTKAILAFMERLGDGPAIASAMGVWAMAILGVTLVGASGMLGKRMGAMFRA